MWAQLVTLGGHSRPSPLGLMETCQEPGGSRVTSSASSDLDPEMSEQASAQQGSGRPQAPSSSKPWRCPPCSPPSRAEMGYPGPTPRRMLRAAAGGSPPGLSSQQLGPGFRADEQKACECWEPPPCLLPGPGGAGRRGSEGGMQRRTEEHAACRGSLRPTRVVVVACTGGLSTACWHPASRWPLAWGLVATLFTPHQSRWLQQCLSAPCPGVRIPCSGTCPSAHPPPSPRLLLQCSPRRAARPDSPPAPPALADTWPRVPTCSLCCTPAGAQPWPLGHSGPGNSTAGWPGSGALPAHLPSLWMPSQMPAQM